MANTSASGSQQPLRPTPEQIREAAQAVGYSLGNQVYAIVGGAAGTLLGSLRITDDVDIVVPQGATRDTRRKLGSQDTYFDVDRRTLHTYFKSNPRVEVEILAPPSLFRESFNDSTPIIRVVGVNVLKPALILNAKCNSILGRATDERKRTDAADIQFCLEWCAANDSFPTGAEVLRATEEFARWFISLYGKEYLWANARYNFNIWSF